MKSKPFALCFSSLSTLLRMRLRITRSLNDVSMSRIHSNNRGCSLGLNTRPLDSFVESNVDDVMKTFVHSSSQHRSTEVNTSFNSIQQNRTDVGAVCSGLSTLVSHTHKKKPFINRLV